MVRCGLKQASESGITSKATNIRNHTHTCNTTMRHAQTHSEPSMICNNIPPLSYYHQYPTCAESGVNKIFLHMGHEFLSCSHSLMHVRPNTWPQARILTAACWTSLGGEEEKEGEGEASPTSRASSLRKARRSTDVFVPAVTSSRKAFSASLSRLG